MPEYSSDVIPQYPLDELRTRKRKSISLFTASFVFGTFFSFLSPYTGFSIPLGFIVGFLLTFVPSVCIVLYESYHKIQNIKEEEFFEQFLKERIEAKPRFEGIKFAGGGTGHKWREGDIFGSSIAQKLYKFYGPPISKTKEDLIHFNYGDSPHVYRVGGEQWFPYVDWQKSQEKFSKEKDSFAEVIAEIARSQDVSQDEVKAIINSYIRSIGERNA